MSHFIMHTRTKGKDRLRYAIAGMVCILIVGAAGYTAHSIGTVRAKSRETVELHTGEELEQYLLDRESEEYNLNGSYRLEEDLDLGWLYQSIGNNIEPFTGKFDGNGHVISGLERPLFGVVKKAEIGNLFISGALITEPFTYYDGEQYVDGYGALAAYAVDSKIRNCGMNGEIHTASPSEAEYQIGKASPSDAKEKKAPAETESSEVLESLENGNGADGSGLTDGAGPESGTAGTGAAGDTTGNNTEGESGAGAETGTGTENDMNGTGEAETGDSDAAGESTEGTPGESNAGNGETGSAGNSGSGTDGSGAADTGNSGSGTNGNGAAGTGNSGSGATDSGNSGSGAAGTGNSGSGATGSGTAGTGSGESGQPEAGTENTAIVYPVNRQHLMLKVSELPDAEAEAAAKASPSDADQEAERPARPEPASPSDADEFETGKTGQDTTKEETEYIGNPYGELCILVTAERVTVGGLVSQTAGETLIADSFVLVTVESVLEEVETYAGGLGGILGGDTRVENSYATGVLSCDDVAGGFAGANEGSIENSYASMVVGEMGRIRGGFTAKEAGSLKNCVYDRQMACAGDQNEETVQSESLTEDQIKGQTESQTGTSGEKTRQRGPGITEEDLLLDESESEETTEEDHTGMIQVGPGEWIETEPAEENSVEPVPGSQPGPGIQGEADQPGLDVQPETVSREAAEEEPQFTLKGLNTAQMTGIDAKVPGRWYYSENAYPQLEEFALSTREIIADSSKASVIALVLPEEFTIEDILRDGDLILPAEIDGQEIQWEAEEGVTIDENNRVHSTALGEVPEAAPMETAPAGASTTEDVPIELPQEPPVVTETSEVSLSHHEAPKVGSAIESAPQDAATGAESPETSAGETLFLEETDVLEGTNGSGNIRIKGGVGGAAKGFSLPQIRQASEAAAAITWEDIAVRVESGDLSGKKPTQASDGYYEIGTPEALAWFAYQVNVVKNYSIKGRLTANIDLFGTDYTNITYDEATDNITEALRWIPIGDGGVKEGYTGAFDGAGHYVYHMFAEGDSYQGFIGNLGQITNSSSSTGNAGGSIQDFGVKSGKVRGGYDYIGGVVGSSQGDGNVILRCWNGASIESEGDYIGGVCGIQNMNNNDILGCYNLGDVKGGKNVGGITGSQYSGAYENIKNCYNQGTVTGKSKVGGIVGWWNYINSTVKVENCYNTGICRAEEETAGAISGTRESSVINCYYDKSKTATIEGTMARGLTTAQMQSWAMAYALNEYGMTSNSSTEVSWTWEAGGYPTLYSPKDSPTKKLAPASDWMIIGQGVADGLIGTYDATTKTGTRIPIPEGNGTADAPYILTNAEQLGWYTWMTNSGGPISISARMTANIDLFGSPYTGITRITAPDNIESALRWNPVTSSSSYGLIGTFDGGGFYVENMGTTQILQSPSGFIGCLGRGDKPGYVKNLGVKSGTVTGRSSGNGGIVGKITGSNCKIERCWNGATIYKSAYNGGIVGECNGVSSLLIEDCYNVGTVGEGATSTGYYAGILGFIHNTGTVTIRNCYNLGEIKMDGRGIAIVYSSSKLELLNCYNGGKAATSSGGHLETVENCYNDSSLTPVTSTGFTSLTTKQLKSWSAAFALNGYKRETTDSSGVSWTWSEGEYPSLYWDGKTNSDGTAATKLAPAQDWDVIGAGMEDGLIGNGYTGVKINPPAGNGTTIPYKIGNAEQLAWFARQITNGTGTTKLNVELTTYIDLGGDAYVDSGILPWIPIGYHIAPNAVTENIRTYSGTFDGGGYVIDRMHVSILGKAGLFAFAGEGALIKNLGIGSRSYVESTGHDQTSDSSATAAFAARVYNRSSWVAANPDQGSLQIEGCYTRAVINGYTSSGTASFIGSSSTVLPANKVEIKGCYAAGKVSSSTGNGYALEGGGSEARAYITSSYWDSTVLGDAITAGGSSVVNSGKKTTAEIKSEATIAQLNAGVTEKNWIYNDPATSKINDGYPILKSQNLITNWAQVAALGVPAPVVPYPGNDTSTYGTEANPYLLSSPEDLAWFAAEVNSGKLTLCGKMVADIDLFGSKYSGVDYDTSSNNITAALEWVPVGHGGTTNAYYKGYAGTFDGNGHQVANLYINGSVSQCGFIGILGNQSGSGVVKDFGVASGKVTGTRAAGICGAVISQSQVRRCWNAADMAGVSYAGGIAGAVETVSGTSIPFNPLIEGCYNLGKISTSSTAGGGGGILGFLSASALKDKVRNCYNLGTVTGVTSAAGIVGFISGTGSGIENCYNGGTCTVTQSGTTYGIGNVTNLTGVANCYYEEGKSIAGVGVADDTTGGAVRKLTAEQLKSFAAAYALNGYGLESEGATGVTPITDETDSSFTYVYGTEAVYPTLCWSGDDDFEDRKLRAESWFDIGAGVDAQLIGDRATKAVVSLPAGTGETSDPYILANAEQLAWYGYHAGKGGNGISSLYGKSGRMAADLDLFGAVYTGETYDSNRNNIEQALRWIPMGKDRKVGVFESASFVSGIFDGGGHKVTNLFVKETSTYGGFISRMEGNAACVKDLEIASGKVSAPVCVGGLVGNINRSGKVLRCRNKADVEGQLYVGGIAGTYSNGSNLTLEGCYNQGNITGESLYVSGILSASLNTYKIPIIRNCGNVGRVSGPYASGISYFAGLQESAELYGGISNCYNAGIVTGSNYSAAIEGTGKGIIINCYYDKTKTSSPGPGITQDKAKGLTTEQLQSWAAAYALNGYGLDQKDASFAAGATTESAWTYPADGTAVYPTICWPDSADPAAVKKLPAASSWRNIGLGMDGGLIGDRVTGTVTPLPTGSGLELSPYQIANAEQLAWFAYQVNQVANKKGICGRLTADINLFGNNYTGYTGDSVIDSALQWVPIAYGDTYTGIFNGAGYKISNMYLPKSMGANYARGLFGGIGQNGLVKSLTVEGANLAVSIGGGIAGMCAGKIEQCISIVNVDAASGNNRSVGGITGQLHGGGRVSSCANYGSISEFNWTTDMRIGGIVGGGFSGSIIENCFNSSSVRTGSYPNLNLHITNGGQIVSPYHFEGTVSNCYYNTTIALTAATGQAASVMSGVTGKTEEQLKTWAAAYALNEQSITGPWKYTPGQYPGFGTLGPAESWAAIGQGVKDQFLKDSTGTLIPEPALSGTAYDLTGEEQLAWFALTVNSAVADQTRNANLTRDMDLTGIRYGGTEAARIPWIPIGTYEGSFGAGHTRVYQIKNLYAGGDRVISKAGLVGILRGQVTRIGMEAPVIGPADPAAERGVWGGAIAATMEGGTPAISKCYTRNAVIKVGETGGAAGGIVGEASDGGTIQDCYTMDSTISCIGRSNNSVSNAGGIVGYKRSVDTVTVENCYVADNTLEAKMGNSTGYIYDIASTTKKINCYSSTPTEVGVGLLEKTQAQTDALNVQRTGNDRTWYTSLENEATKGYPTLDAPEILTAELNPAASKAGSKGTLQGGTLPAQMLLRGVHEQGGDSTTLGKMISKEMLLKNYSIYGYQNANRNLYLGMGTASLSSYEASASLTNPSSANVIPGFSEIELYNGAAYTAPERRILLEVCDKDKTRRYEISITIKDPAAKTLSLTFPVNPASIELNPGMKQKSESGEVTMTNANDYPVTGRITSVTPMADKDIQLQPIASSLNTINRNQDLSVAGVKLGISKVSGGTAEYYYKPETKGAWMTYNMTGQQETGKNSIKFRYFMEYSPLYAGQEQTFGYKIQYSVGLPEYDVSTTTMTEDTTGSGG